MLEWERFPEATRPRTVLPAAALTGLWALALGGFWVLLGNRFSPETYQVLPAAAGPLELVWLSVGLTAALVVTVSCWRDTNVCGQLVSAGRLLGMVCVVLLIKHWAAWPIKCYDALLFAGAAGWMVARAASRREPSASPRWVGPALWLVGLGLAGYYVCQQFGCYRDLVLGYWDCGQSARELHNTLHSPSELFLRANPNHPLFWDHFQPATLLFVPLWALWPSLKLLVVLQVVTILGAAVPVYWLGKQAWQDTLAAALLALGWLVYPSVSQLIYRVSYGFTWTSVCLLLYFVALVLWRQGRPGWAVATAVVAVLLREEAAIILGMFGLYLVLFGRQKRAGAALAIAGFGYFLVIGWWVIPALSGAPYQSLRYYTQLGGSFGEILRSPLVKPRLFWGKLWEPSVLFFLATLLTPLLLLPLKKPSILFVGSLTFVFICLWDENSSKSICWHYQTALLPVLFLATTEALPAGSADGPRRWRRAALLGVVASGVLLTLFLGNAWWSKQTVPIRRAPGRLALVQRFGQSIPQNATLVATDRLAAHFLYQRYLYLSGLVPADTDFALLDLREQFRPRAGVDWLRGLRAAQRQVEALPDLHLTAAADGLLLYARRGPILDARALVETNALPANAIRQTIELGGGIRVAGVTVSRQPAGQSAPQICVRIYSTPVCPVAGDWATRCILQFGEKENYVSEFQPLGQGIWPTPRWLTGRFYVDDFVVPVPREFLDRQFRLSFLAEPLTAANPTVNGAETHRRSP